MKFDTKKITFTAMMVALALIFEIFSTFVLPLPQGGNVFKELDSDLGISNTNGDLRVWAKQGVFLLNTILTVEDGKALSHKNIGWEVFTKKIIEILSEDNNPKVFLLWGNQAKKFSQLILNSKHLVITSAHPSPLSAYNGFFGSKPFSKINNFLISNNLSPIDWKT